MHGHRSYVIALFILVRVAHVTFRVACVIEDPQGDWGPGDSNLHKATVIIKRGPERMASREDL